MLASVSLVLGILALVVAAVAAAFGGLAWWEARRSAGAARDSADAAKRSAEVAERQEVQQRAERRAAAALVTAELSYMGALEVTITNASSTSIRSLQIVSITSEQEPDWTWTVNPRVMGAQSRWAVVGPGETVRCPIEFISDHGVTMRRAGDRYLVVFDFTDSSGVTWRNSGGDLEQLGPPDR